MPCNGVAVAAGRLPADLEKYLALLTPDQIAAAVAAWLQSQAGLTVAPPAIRGRRIAFNLGQMTLEIEGGRVAVSTFSRAAAAGQLGQQIQQGVSALLTGLAGKARQAALVAALSRAGVRVDSQQTAPNGAIVLNVEF